MKFTSILSIMLLLCALSTAASGEQKYSFRIENPEKVDMQMDGVQALVDLIRLYRYRCDSVSSLFKVAGKTAFMMWCNQYAYSYEIADRGGRWTVTYKD